MTYCVPPPHYGPRFPESPFPSAACLQRSRQRGPPARPQTAHAQAHPALSETCAAASWSAARQELTCNVRMDTWALHLHSRVCARARRGPAAARSRLCPPLWLPWCAGLGRPPNFSKEKNPSRPHPLRQTPKPTSSHPRGRPGSGVVCYRIWGGLLSGDSVCIIVYYLCIIVCIIGMASSCCIIQDSMSLSCIISVLSEFC